jgi:ICP0-binding domain of Ubiquitin-specific protease 7
MGWGLQVAIVKAKKGREFRDFKAEIASRFNVEQDQMRLWFWSKRSNNTYRPSRALPASEESTRVEMLSELPHSVYHAKAVTPHNINFFLEVPTEPGKPLPPLTEKGQFFLFFKFYDPHTETLSVRPSWLTPPGHVPHMYQPGGKGGGDALSCLLLCYR